MLTEGVNVTLPRLYSVCALPNDIVAIVLLDGFEFVGAAFWTHRPKLSLLFLNENAVHTLYIHDKVYVCPEVTDIAGEYTFSHVPLTDYLHMYVFLAPDCSTCV